VQKKDRKASILIWSIFLSLIISISFLSISTQITKNLKNANNLKNNLETENNINNLLKNTNNDTEEI
jgi:predicted PurR-regulated permease PerM